MSPESRRIAGILLVALPTVMIGGVSLLSLLVWEPAYAANQIRQDLWRAGHAHAGVLLVLGLLILRYVDEARLGERGKWFVRLSAPSAAILMPMAFFLSVLSPQATAPNALIYVAYAGLFQGPFKPCHSSEIRERRILTGVHDANMEHPPNALLPSRSEERERMLNGPIEGHVFVGKADPIGVVEGGSPFQAFH